VDGSGIQFYGRALQRFVARDATRGPADSCEELPALCTHLFSLFISIPLHSIIASAIIFWHAFFSFPDFPFYYLLLYLKFS
jgi:hypothetical protein